MGILSLMWMPFGLKSTQSSHISATHGVHSYLFNSYRFKPWASSQCQIFLDVIMIIILNQVAAVLQWLRNARLKLKAMKYAFARKEVHALFARVMWSLLWLQNQTLLQLLSCQGMLRRHPWEIWEEEQVFSSLRCMGFEELLSVTVLLHHAYYRCLSRWPVHHETCWPLLLQSPRGILIVSASAVRQAVGSLHCHIKKFRARSRDQPPDSTSARLRRSYKYGTVVLDNGTHNGGGPDTRADESRQCSGIAEYVTCVTHLALNQ